MKVKDLIKELQQIEDQELDVVDVESVEEQYDKSPFPVSVVLKDRYNQQL